MDERENLENQNDGVDEQPEEEKKFTQAEVDALINKRYAKWKKDMPSDEELSAFREYQKAHQSDDAKLKDIESARDSAQTELEMAKRENFLLKQGVSADDVDYYVYKITKSMDEDDEFEDAAKKFLKEHKPKNSVRFDTGARFNGGSNGKKNANEQMNDLLRAARG